jgi:hypothetical protein
MKCKNLLLNYQNLYINIIKSINLHRLQNEEYLLKAKDYILEAIKHSEAIKDRKVFFTIFFFYE